jgi:hypothetical protein
VGDDDAVKSTALGLRNLQRIEKMLVPATTAKTGESFDDLVEMYGTLISQWTTELNHVVAIVGGSTSQAKNAGQTGVVYTPMPAARQRAAVAFLSQSAFATPEWLIDPEVLRRIEPAGALNRIRTAQSGVLSNLLDSGRFARIVEQETMDPKTAYPAVDFLAAVRLAVWGELNRAQVKIDAYRRSLQRAYLDLAVARVNGGNTDERSLYRAELKSLDVWLARSINASADRETRAHLDSAREQIAVALDPRRYDERIK